MGTLRATGLAAIALALTLGAACGGDEPGQAPPEPLEAYKRCSEPGLSDAEISICTAHKDGREAGALDGKREAAAEIELRTRDGYRLRRWVSRSVLGVGSVIIGTILGALAFTLLRRRKGTRYAGHALAVIEGEADAIRAMGAGDNVDPLVKGLIDRVRLVLSETEHQARKIVDKCTPIEDSSGDEDATKRAHLRTYHDRLDELAGRVERLRVQVTVWKEKVTLEGTDKDHLDESVKAALEELKSAMDEVSA